MMTVLCSCGHSIDVPFDSLGEPAECPKCERILRVVAAQQPTEESVGSGRLIISEGPDRIGEQLILAGDGPIAIGKLPVNPINLVGPDISRNHAQLLRQDGQWVIEDLQSETGVLINDAPISSHPLQTGDIVKIGPYELEFEAVEASHAGIVTADSPGQPALQAAAHPNPTRAAPTQTFRAPAPTQLAGGVVCPACGRSLPFGSKICVTCGVDVRTGRQLLTSREFDEDALYANTENIVRVLSFILPFGLYPIASEGLGWRRPWVIWIIAAATALIGLGCILDFASRHNGSPAGENLMLWVGQPVQFVPKPWTLQEQLAGKAEALPSGEFHWWQVLTYALVDRDILRLAGNMVFLLVLGSRVNALIGPLKTAVLYPLLAVAAGITFVAANSHGPLAPMLGASGAVMGLAGMYFVLFPIHRVHMVIWLRWFSFNAGFPLSQKIFAVRGFWVVLFYIAFDVLATLIGNRDHVAQWAHLGGFVAGFLIALILLLARQVDAHGADLISAMLGRYSWAILGKPGERG